MFTLNLLYWPFSNHLFHAGETKMKELTFTHSSLSQGYVSKPWCGQDREATISKHPQPASAAESTWDHLMDELRSQCGCLTHWQSSCCLHKPHVFSQVSSCPPFPLALNQPMSFCTPWCWDDDLLPVLLKLQGSQASPHCHFLPCTVFSSSMYLAQAWTVPAPASFSGVAPLPSDLPLSLSPQSFLSLPLPSTNSSLLA